MRISGMLEHTKINHSPLKIGNKIALFSGNKKFKTIFAPFLTKPK